jgi:hypothetical protein
MTLRASVVVAALSLAACSSTAPGPRNVGPTSDASTEDTTPHCSDTDVATDATLTNFSRALTRWFSSEWYPQQDLSTVIARSSLVAHGKLIGVTHGRKEFLGRGCTSIGVIDERAPCENNSDASDGVLYASYVNLIFRARSTLKGTLPSPDSPISIEFPWPNNAPLDALFSEAPLCSDAVLFAEEVPSAAEAAAPLIEAGILASDAVAPNLFQVSPYGFVVPAEDGEAVMPLLHNESLDTALVAPPAKPYMFNDLLKDVEEANP